MSNRALQKLTNASTLTIVTINRIVPRVMISIIPGTDMIIHLLAW